MTTAPPTLPHRRHMTWLIFAIMVPLLYLGSYVALSVTGRYVDSGGLTASADTIHWEWAPLGFGYPWAPSRPRIILARILRLIYWPCYHIDWLHLHPPVICPSPP